MTPQQTLDTCLRADRGRLIAALVAGIGDFQRAEDALHQAAISALVQWARAGIPKRPDGWLRRAARIDSAGCIIPPAPHKTAACGTWANCGRAGRSGIRPSPAITRRDPGPYQIKAAIAACHMTEPTADWPQITALYAALHHHEPTPVISLNHAVAMAETGDLPRALAVLETLATVLAMINPTAPRAGRIRDSRTVFDRAIAATAPHDAAFLCKARAALPT